MTVRELLNKYGYPKDEVRFYEDEDVEAYRDTIENILNSRTFYLNCEVEEFVFDNGHLEILLR